MARADDGFSLSECLLLVPPVGLRHQSLVKSGHKLLGDIVADLP